MPTDTFASLEVRQRIEKLYKKHPFLRKLNESVDWEAFRPILEAVRPQPSPFGGRPTYDPILLFKCIIIKTSYNLSNAETEFQILNQLVFQDFLGLGLDSDVPDPNTLWNFQEELKKGGVERKVFDKFNEMLGAKGLKPQGGHIVDATFVEVPEQHNSREENKEIKAGHIPESFSANPRKGCQKGTDARWTKKNNVSYYGYKNNVDSDVKYKVVRNYSVTSASVHDSVPFLDLLPSEASEGDDDVWADSAYVEAETEKKLLKRQYKPHICEKGFRNNPLSEEQKVNNREKPKICSRVEHIIGVMLFFSQRQRPLLFVTLS
jgi:IS5 family transposase